MADFEKLKDTFTDRIYVEIQRHGENLEKNNENFLPSGRFRITILGGIGKKTFKKKHD